MWAKRGSYFGANRSLISALMESLIGGVGRLPRWWLVVMPEQISGVACLPEDARQVIVNGATSNAGGRCCTWRVWNSSHQTLPLLTGETEVQ